MSAILGIRINGVIQGLGGGVEIDDAVTVTDKAWSSSKIDTDIGALQAGASPKASVDVVTQTAGNITLSGLQNLDGETGVVDDEVGVTAQTDPIENGVYLMKTGAWVRRTDFDGTPSGEVKDGVYFRVTNGTVHQNQVFMVISSGSAVDVGTDPITFDQHKNIEIGTGAGQAAEGNDSRIPTQDENNALAGTDGTPSATNEFVTNTDPRLVAAAKPAYVSILTDMNDSSYIQVGPIFRFPGTNNVDGPSAIHIVGKKDSNPTSYDVKIVDLTNTQIIAEITGVTNTAFAIVDLGTISNVSATEAQWRLEARRNGSPGSVQIEGLTIQT